jgi:hypothetical protein
MNVDGIGKKLETIFETAQNEMQKIVESEIASLPAEMDIDIDELSSLDDSPAQGQSAAPEQTSNAVTISDDVPSVAIQNQNYIEEKLRESAAANKHILDVLNEEIRDNKIPTNMKLRAYEVHANITNSISLLMREMRELAKMRLGIDMVATEYMIRAKSKDKPKGSGDDNTIPLTSGQLLKIIKDAQRQPHMDIEDINFTVVEASKP